MRVSTGISIEAEILREAKIRASKMRRTFSNYVEGLIIEDIEKQPVINSNQHDNTKGGLKKRKGASQLHKVKSFNELKELIRVRRDYYPTNYMDCLLLDNKKDTLSKIVKKFRQYAEPIKFNDLLTVPRLKAHVKYRIFHDGWIFKTSGDPRDPIVTLVGLKKK